MKLDRRSLERLVKLLGMLGSNHGGERAAAALKANALLREHNLVWSDVVISTPDQRSSSDFSDHARASAANRRNGDAGGKKQDDQKVDWRTMRDFCAQHSSLLRPREQKFIDHIDSWRGALTQKQNDWLLSIYTRVKKLAA